MTQEKKACEKIFGNMSSTLELFVNNFPGKESLKVTSIEEQVLVVEKNNPESRNLLMNVDEKYFNSRGLIQAKHQFASRVSTNHGD